MRIPKSFLIQDHLIKISFVDKLEGPNGEQWMGEADSDRNTIKLCRYITRNGKRVRVPQSQVLHTLYHELIHIILDRMGENKLSGKEKFVDSFAGLLLQFMNTKKY